MLWRFLVFLCFSIAIHANTDPKHVHLSLSSKPDEMTVVWFTEDAAESYVHYRIGKKELKVSGNSFPLKYSDAKVPGFIHVATMTSLEPYSIYSYRVGGEDTGWSANFHFRSQPNSTGRPREDKVKIIAYGDMGVKWSTSLESVKALTPVARGLDADIILHAGDLAYAFGNFTIWNWWFERIQNVAAYVPYMICPGNRDEDQIIEERFRMPVDLGSGIQRNPSRHNFFYSVDYMWVHIVSISIKDDFKPGSEQYKWLEHDLKDAYSRIISKTDSIRWIILIGHTPLYSSSNGHTGGNKDLKAAIEDLLHQFEVTLAVWGDDHVYERTYPLYQDVPDTQFVKDEIPVFYSPNKTIHILAGTGGIELDGWAEGGPPTWSAARELSNGHVGIEVTGDEMRVKFTRLDGSVADDFLIKKISIASSTPSIGYGIFFFVFGSIGFIFLVRTKRQPFGHRRTLVTSVHNVLSSNIHS